MCDTILYFYIKIAFFIAIVLFGCHKTHVHFYAFYNQKCRHFGEEGVGDI